MRCGPVLRGRLGGTRYVYLLSPEANELVMAHDSWFSVGEPMKTIALVDGPTSVVVSDGPDHTRRRGILRPALAPRAIANYLDAIHLSAREALEAFPADTPVDSYPVFRTAIRRSTLRSLFGPAMAADADLLGKELQPLLDLVDLLPQAIEIHRRLGTPRWRRAQAARRRLDEHVARRIEEAAAHAPGEVDGFDMLDALVHGHDGSGFKLTHQEIRDQTITLVAAGFATTSAAMGWAVYTLARHPQWQKRAHDEARAFMAGSGDMDAIKQLTVLPAIVRETLRLYPSATILARRVERPFTIHGVDVHEGETVILSPYATHRDPRNHDRPTTFDPDRWADGPPAPGTYIPWGGGAHRCLGSRLAETELIIMLAHLVAAGPFRSFGRRPRASSFAAMRPSHARIVRSSETP